jgi:hypothetical protein
MAETVQQRAEKEGVDLVVLRQQHLQADRAGAMPFRRLPVDRIDAEPGAFGRHLQDDPEERGAAHRPDQIGVEAAGAEFAALVPAARRHQKGGGDVASGSLADRPYGFCRLRR